MQIFTDFVDPAHGGLDRIIPLNVLKRAQGFAFFSVFRMGFLVSARAGSGVVIVKLPDGSWSCPSAIGLGGLGGGFNAGVDVTDVLIVLNNGQAVRSFMSTGSLQLGGNLSLAVGPLGRAAEASGAINSSGSIAAMFSYSKSKGLYGGVSLEGTVLIDRSDANSKAYNRLVTAKQLLSGSIDPPEFAQPLINTIEKLTMTGRVRDGIDDGLRDNDDGYSFDDGLSRTGTGMDSLDRELRGARRSPDSTRRSKGFVDDYKSQRPGDYAFGSSNGGSQTNSPTRLRKSFLGNSYNTSKGTDYTQDSNGVTSVFDPTGKTDRRAQYQRSKSSLGSGSLFGDDAAVDIAPPQTRRNQSYNSNFATKFERHSEDDSDTPPTKVKNGKVEENDVFGQPIRNRQSRDSWEEEDALRRAPHASFNRVGSNDLLDFELDRSAVTQRQAPRTQERDLIDLMNEPNIRKTSNGNNRKGYDNLDRELQTRLSMSSNDSAEQRQQYSPPDYQSRPKMAPRTSSAQKIMSRIRGNSTSSKNAFANLDTWDQRYRTPSPRVNGSASSSPPVVKSSTPTGFRSGGTPTGFKSSTPTGYRSGSTPTGFKSTPSTSPQTPYTPQSYQSSVQVIAEFNFDGQEEDDLGFKKGDVIDVVKRTPNREDWWLGRRAGRMGNFPANYTQDV